MYSNLNQKIRQNTTDQQIHIMWQCQLSDSDNRCPFWPAALIHRGLSDENKTSLSLNWLQTERHSQQFNHIEILDWSLFKFLGFKTVCYSKNVGSYWKSITPKHNNNIDNNSNNKNLFLNI